MSSFPATVRKLLSDAQRLGGHPTEKAALMAALREYVERRSQMPIVAAFGTIEYDKDYDYKKQRRRR